MTLYSEVDTEEYYDSIAKTLLKKKGSAKFPTNEDLKTALRDKDLYNTQPKNRNYLFEMLENYNNREYVNTNNENITIEHIFPRNPNEDWNSDLSSDEYFLFKEKHLNTIGNLTLSGNNGALSNKSFLAKKEMNNDGKEQGYNYSRLWLNSYLKSIDGWNISKYEERLNIIYDRFLNIWEFPNVVLLENDESEEQNIFDAESPKNKKLEYYIFENTTIEEDTISQMYCSIIQYLYDKNSQLLVSHQDI
ncbi:MAG: HNH endonuclease family protein, partial [Flavobacteriaceae bacterium]|nr:HNH endonuclease family protein [Flavobacteriaceae bacterium]